MDVNNGFILATTLTPGSESDSVNLLYLTIDSCHRKEPVDKVYTNKKYYGQPNNSFRYLKKIGDGVMRKDLINAKFAESEIKRNKNKSNKRYSVDQYFGMSHLHDGA